VSTSTPWLRYGITNGAFAVVELFDTVTAANVLSF
jgi:hypothetical protein